MTLSTAIRGQCKCKSLATCLTGTLVFAVLGCGTLPFPPNSTGGPTADASLTQATVNAGENGIGQLTLDATQSRAGSADFESFEWFSDGEMIAEGEQVDIDLDPGTYAIELVVTDAQGATAVDIISIEVIAPPRDSFNLTISTLGRGQVFPDLGTTSWPAGTAVELRAVPGEGFRFVGWDGDLDSALSLTTIILDDDKTITATFDAVVDDGLPAFNLPLPADTSRTISQGNLDELSHTDHYAWDFPMPTGTPVVAAGGGRVVNILEDSPPNPGGPIVISHPANYVRIDHGNGLISVYAHFDQSQVFVEPGQYVTRGQVLGLSGNTGVSTGPHLHFELEDAAGTSVPSRFIDVPEKDGVPVRGDVVLSRNELDVNSLQGFSPSPMPTDIFLVNQIELTEPTPPAFFLQTETEYHIAGRVLDGRQRVCLALVEPIDYETVFCDLQEVQPDGTFDIAFTFPPEMLGRYYAGVISGMAGAEGITPLQVLIEPPPDGQPSPVAVVQQPAGPMIDFGQTGVLLGSGSVTARRAGLAYRWVQVSGPPATIDDPTAADTTFTIDFGEGIERVAFQLTVFDGQRTSAPAQVDYLMPDTFHVGGLNVANRTCTSKEDCPVADPPIVSLSSGVLTGWAELVNVEDSDVLEMVILDPNANVRYRAELNVNEKPPATSFWTFGWSSSGQELEPGLWTAAIMRNGQFEGSISFRWST